MNKPMFSSYGNTFHFLLISIYIIQCFYYTAVSTNRLSHHFRVANAIQNTSRRWDNVGFFFVWLSLSHPLLLTNDLNNSEYYIHQKTYTLKMRVLPSTNSGFSLATQKQLKTILKP